MTSDASPARLERSVVDDVARDPFPERALRVLRRRSRRLVAGWRRSLTLRVVLTTLTLSSVVILALGNVLLNRIVDGLLHAKVEAALVEASIGTADANGTFAAATTSSVDTVAYDEVTRLAGAGGTAGLHSVVALRAPSSKAIGLQNAYTSGDIAADTIPADLRAEVEGPRDRQAWRYVTLRVPGHPDQPALAVGSRVTTAVGPLELYYVFPLEKEQATVTLVQQTLAVGGLALVVLLGTLIWMVTRQVVTPVRMAARIAERLAAGRLEERMRVRGEDDLARLATAFNKMATNLRRQIRQLEDLSRLQQRFVTDVSHELRTPLTTVRMAADVLHEARADFDPAVARSAELLQTQLDRFESLLSDLLEISRFDAGAANLDTEAVDLTRVVDGVVDATAMLAERRGSRVEVVTPHVPCIVECDPRRIERVLRNLLVNAIEHGEGAPIHVRIASDDTAAAVGVRDHGVGLADGEAALVFNRFWRADPARARTTGGTGLGLSISLEDTRLHGGWLQAWGRPGDGSHFRLTLPRRAGADIDASPLPMEPPDARPSRITAKVLAVGAPYRRAGSDDTRSLP